MCKLRRFGLIRYPKVVDIHTSLLNLYARLHGVALFYNVSNCLATETFGLKSSRRVLLLSQQELRTEKK